MERTHFELMEAYRHIRERVVDAGLKLSGKTSRALIRLTGIDIERQQEKQQKEIEAELRENNMPATSIIRSTDGSGGESLETLLKEKQTKNKIVFLMNGIVKPPDPGQVIPSLRKFETKLLRIERDIRRKISNIIDFLKGKKEKKPEVVDLECIEKDTLESYFIETAKKIKTELFNEQDCEVVMVRNASQKDFLNSVEQGGGNTVLVVSGHGTRGTVAMTDGMVRNTAIRTPNQPLRAFVQHTCAGKDREPEELGSRWSSRIYGWERATYTIDFIDDPLPLRTSEGLNIERRRLVQALRRVKEPEELEPDERELLSSWIRKREERSNIILSFQYAELYSDAGHFTFALRALKDADSIAENGELRGTTIHELVLAEIDHLRTIVEKQGGKRLWEEVRETVNEWLREDGIPIKPPTSRSPPLFPFQEPPGSL